jgi:hypothetical protein
MEVRERCYSFILSRTPHETVPNTTRDFLQWNKMFVCYKSEIQWIAHRTIQLPTARTYVSQLYESIVNLWYKRQNIFFKVSDSGIRTLARRCYKLRYLNARGCGALGDDGVEAVARGCSRLRALDLGATDVSEAGLQVTTYNIKYIYIHRNTYIHTYRCSMVPRSVRSTCHRWS